MLSDEVLEKVSERLINRIEKANEFILRKIGKNIKTIGELNYSEAYEIAQIMKYGGDYEKIIDKLAEITALNDEDIRKIFDEVVKSEYDFSEQFYNYKNVPYIPYEENIALQNQVRAISNLTQRNINYMMNPSTLGYGIINSDGQVEYKGLREAYFDLIDQAVLSIGQGKQTFDEAMTAQIKEMGGGGLRTIYDSTYVDKEGIVRNRSRRLDSSVRMNIKDGLRSLHNESQDLFGREFGADGVEISVHSYPAEDHAEMQGRQFSKEEYNKLQEGGVAKDYKGKLIDINRTSKKGITFHRPVSQYNCYHYTFAIVLGVSSPEYTDEQLQELIDDNEKGFEMNGQHYTTYEGTQMQRRLETEVRKLKDIQIMAKESGQSELVAETQAKITQITNKYRELSYKAGLPTKMDRMKVSGYRRINVSNIEPKDRFNITISKEEQDRRLNYKIEHVKEEIGYRKDMLSGIPEDSKYNSDISHRNILNRDIAKFEKELESLNSEVTKDKIIDINTKEGCSDLLKEINIELQDKNLDRIDIDVLKENTLHYYDVCKKYPFLEQSLQEQSLKLAFDNLPGGTIGLAEKSGRKIELDISDNIDKKDVLYWGEYQTKSGYNMPCSKDNYINYFATHELGHSFNYRVINNVDISGLEDLSARDFYQKTNEYFMDNIYKIAEKNTGKPREELESLLSEYGKSNIDETMAELFANANCGKPNALGTAFDEYFKELLK